MKDLREFVEKIVNEVFKDNKFSELKLELNKYNLENIILKLRKNKKYIKCTIEDINQGLCDDFAVDVARKFFDDDTVETLFFRELNGLSLVTYEDFLETKEIDEPHTWIMYDGKHYDVEVPYGVDNPLELPIFKRFINKLKLNEVYSKDMEEIKDFLNNLEFPLELYRGIILGKGEKLNKKDLGIHWSLDIDFVENLYHYETFGGGTEEILEDYKFYIITALFNKDQIDFEKTIDKRLIKDSGHFWDDLTGEFIENSDMLKHPYSHEDEITVKKGAKPKIINIEKIDISDY